MAESTASLRAEIKALSGVDIMLDDTTFKSTYQIMDELSQKWKNLSDIAQATIIELVAGKHQGNVFSSLMANFDIAKNALNTSIGSSGSAMQEHGKWSQSVEASLNSLKASWQSFAQTFMDSKTLKTGIDLLSGLVNILEKLIDTFGVLGTTGGVISVVKIVKGFKNVKSAAKEAADETKKNVEALNRETGAVNVNAEAKNTAASAGQQLATSNELVSNSAVESAEKHLTDATSARVAAENKLELATVTRTKREESLRNAQTKLFNAECTETSTEAEKEEIRTKIRGAEAELEDAKKNEINARSELDQAKKTEISAQKELNEIRAKAASSNAEFNDSLNNTTKGANNAAGAVGNLGENIKNAGKESDKSAKKNKSFFKSFGVWMTFASMAIMAISAFYNAWKKGKEKAAELRQEAIESADAFLDASSTFEQAYIKYSGRTDLTVEEEEDLKSAINGTVEALDDKSSALHSAVNASNDYVASLEAIKKAELEAAKSKAFQKKENAVKSLEEAVVGYSKLDGSEVGVTISGLGAGANNEGEDIAMKIAEDMSSEFFKKNKEFVGRAKRQEINFFGLSPDAELSEMIDYYNTLLDYRERLEKAYEDGEFDVDNINDIGAYTNVTSAIDKMSESIEVYVSGLYESVKATYLLEKANGNIPKTAEEYVKMREAILSDDEVKTLSVNQKLSIVNSLDSEYGTSIDLTDAKTQARKLIGVLDEYTEDNAGQVETFINMRTMVNNNDCTVGDYLSEFSKVDSLTAGWDEESKKIFNTSFGIDSDSVKKQYDDVYKYIERNHLNKLNNIDKMSMFNAAEYRSTEEQRIKDLINGLTKTELQALYNIRAEIDFTNSIEDIRKQIKEEAKVVEALSFEAKIETDTTSLEALNTAIEESASAIGMSTESIDSLKAKYSELEGYNPDTLFEATANGVKVNREELEKLEEKYNDLNKAKVKEHIENLTKAYNDNVAAIDSCTSASKRAELISKNETYKSQIEELATYQAQLEGVTGAYQEWIDAQSGSENYEGYESVATSREDIQGEIDRGFIGNKSKKYIDLLSGKDLDGGSIDDYYNAWQELEEKVGNTEYTIHDFFTLTEDGDITSTGIDNFFEGIRKEVENGNEKFVKIAKQNEAGEWIYDFSQENLQKIQEEWGIGIEAIGLLLEAAADAGYNVDWGGIFDDIDLDTSDFETLVDWAESAQSELNKLEGYENLKFNFATTNIEDATTEIEKAQKVYNDLVDPDGDGKNIELDVKGAGNARVILSTLLVQKQQLEDSEIAINISTSGFDESQAKQAEAVAWVQDFREKYKNLEIAISTGEGIEEAKEGLANVQTSLGKLDGQTAEIAAQLVLGEGTDIDGDGFKAQVNNAIASIGEQDIEVGFKLDGTGIGDLNSQLLTNFTVDATAKITNVDKSQLETVETEGLVNWNENTDNVSKTFEASGTVNWDDNEANLKKSFSANGTVKWTSGNKVKVDVVSEVNGTANANGTTQSGKAFKQGSWGIKGSGTALVGELGMETLVRGGKFYTIGNSGAEFIQYRPNDIIFNHKQTEELFKYGKVLSDGGRGSVYANGSAFAEGNYPSSGKAFWKASASSSIFANRKLDNEVKSNTKTETKNNKNSVKTITTTTWDATASGNGLPKNYKDNGEEKETSGGDGGSSKEEFKETLDWIETKINRIERAINKLDLKANSVYKAWSIRNKALADEIVKVGEEIDIQQAGYERYLKEANSVGLSASWAEKVRNGKIDIETIKDEALAEKIKEYQQWYDKALACQDAIEELKETEASLYAQRFENVQTQYDAILQGYEHTESMLNEYISQAEEKGYIVSKKYYEALIANEKSNIAELKKEQSDLLNARDEAVDSGKITKYSEEW